jgi:hypothetical protein
MSRAPPKPQSMWPPCVRARADDKRAPPPAEVTEVVVERWRRRGRARGSYAVGGSERTPNAGINPSYTTCGRERRVNVNPRRRVLPAAHGYYLLSGFWIGYRPRETVLQSSLRVMRQCKKSLSSLVVWATRREATAPSRTRGSARVAHHAALVDTSSVRVRRRNLWRPISLL